MDIRSENYQNCARACIDAFLCKFQPSAKPRSLSVIGKDEVPISLRVNANPPNIQIIEFPIGGKNAGITRIREKLNIALSPIDIVVVSAEDLTRELIITQSADDVIRQIIATGLVDRIAAQFLKELADSQPALFIILQRYLMGIETTDKQAIPFHLVTGDNDKIFQHIQEIAGYLV